MSHLRCHYLKCGSSPKYKDVGIMMDNQGTLLKQYKFDDKAYWVALARAIIKHGLPYSYAEYEGVWEVNKVLNPEFKPCSRNTTKVDINEVHVTEKAKLKSVLSSISNWFFVGSCN